MVAKSLRPVNRRLAASDVCRLRFDGALTGKAGGARVKRTMPIPLLLHGRHAGPDVVYQPFGPWIVPWRFQPACPAGAVGRPAAAEYDALRAGVGLLDYSIQALIEVRGADRAAFLHQLLTNEIRRLAPGAGCQAALVTPSAKLIADLLVLADADALWLLCELPRAEMIAQTLERHLFSEQVTLAYHERRWATLALQGPRTFELLSRLFGAVVSLPTPGDHAIHRLEGVPIRLIRHTLTGEAGALCLLEARALQPLWERLRQRASAWGLTLVGWEALNIARIEAGLPWFGVDMDESNLLPETGLEMTAVSDSKGCYLGQEIIARMGTYGSASKKLRGLLLEGTRVPEAGAPILRDGETLGRVTSACDSPALRRPIAMGYVKRPFYDVGARVEILHEGELMAATLVERPFLNTVQRPS